MKEVIITCCLITLGFALTGCTSERELDQVKHEEITNMSRLPFDLTKLESESESSNTNLMFLSSTVEPHVNKFEISLKDLTVSATGNDYYFSYIDERGAQIYNSVNDNTQLKSTEIEGGVQVLYTMSSEMSPNEFILELDFSDDSELIVDENNQYYVLNSSGDVEVYIGQPWAVDANGEFVDTYYVIEDNVIRQVINYEGSNYPVQADPLFCTNTIDNGATVWDPIYNNSSLKVVPTTCARVYLATMWAGMSLTSASMPVIFLSTSLGYDMYHELTTDAEYIEYITYNQAGIKNQFICHAVNPFTITKSSWNLEPWRPNPGWLLTYTAGCNPS